MDMRRADSGSSSRADETNVETIAFPATEVKAGGDRHYKMSLLSMPLGNAPTLLPGPWAMWRPKNAIWDFYRLRAKPNRYFKGQLPRLVS